MKSFCLFCAFCAAICHAGMAALPLELKDVDDAGRGVVACDVLLGIAKLGALPAPLTPVTLLLLPGAVSWTGVCTALLERLEMFAGCVLGILAMPPPPPPPMRLLISIFKLASSVLSSFS